MTIYYIKVARFYRIVVSLRILRFYKIFVFDSAFLPKICEFGFRIFTAASCLAVFMVAFNIFFIDK